VPTRLREVSDSLLSIGIWHTPIRIERSERAQADGARQAIPSFFAATERGTM
jgi:hypothetical protein